MLRDRLDAGAQLAERLARAALRDPIVLGVPRGGVVVGYEIARRLAAPLDVVIARKVGAPGEPEYGVGAVAEGGIVTIDEGRIRALGLSPDDLAPAVAREQLELADRAARFRGERPPPDLRDRSAIVVDDGVATGGTVEAALRVARARGPATLVAAVGVAPREALPRLRAVADSVEVVLTPRRLEAVGEWYERFEPVGDGEVVQLLEAARSFVGPPAA